MPTPERLELHKLRLAKSRAQAQNPVDIVTVAELNMAIERVQRGNKLQLDPVTRAFYNSVNSRNTRPNPPTNP